MDTKEFNSIVFEIVRIALADADLFDLIASELDLSDEVMIAVREEVQRLTSEV